MCGSIETMSRDHGDKNTHPTAVDLAETDPPKVGEFWLDARLTSSSAGVVFLAHSASFRSVMVILLSEGAATDRAARDRFSGEINKLHIDTVVARGGQDQDYGRLGVRYQATQASPHTGDDAPLAPWVALRYDGSAAAVAEAERILAHVNLSGMAPLSAPRGPSYSLHWSEQKDPGVWRIWPLPWPGRQDRRGWVGYLTSLLLVIAVCALALLIAVLIFQLPPEPPPSGGGGGSDSNSSSSPTETASGEGSPEPPPTTVPPSMPSEGGESPTDSDQSPTPNRKLVVDGLWVLDEQTSQWTLTPASMSAVSGSSLAHKTPATP